MHLCVFISWLSSEQITEFSVSFSCVAVVHPGLLHY